MNAINYNDTSFFDLPGNAFLIDIGNETLAVTCKHTLWVNSPKDLSNVDLSGELKTWKMVVPNDSSQYVILGDLVNTDSMEMIGEQNIDEDFLVFKIKENYSSIVPLKISNKLVQSGDTVYQQGWSFQFKNEPPRAYPAQTVQYYGASLLVNSLVNHNGAGLSGSPVLSSNNKLLGIVSSWKYHLPDSTWHEAICSTDYLWIVLYKYWIKENKLGQDIETFNLFLQSYESKNYSKPEISSYVLTKLFYKDVKNKSIENYKKWIDNTEKKYGNKILMDSYQKSILIFETWKNKYLQNKTSLENLTVELKKENVTYPEMLVFFNFSQELIDLKKPELAIELLLFTDTIHQHAGQLYAFIGDAYKARGDKIKAKKYYQKCLITYPSFPQAVKGLKSLGN
ncbi:MAG: hypothetical protein JEY96_05885 [Bacteroidales bacterium]|nr:hypothetical protein [Bacteroidales bacterium]